MTDAETCIWPFIEQMEAASDAELYWAALALALVLPDILGALAAEDGRSTPSRYRAWVEQNLRQSSEDAKRLYGFRCSLLHQGSPYPHGGHPRLAFMHPAAGQLHNLSTQVGDDIVGWISVPMFVEDLKAATRRWIDIYGATKRVERNLEKFARLRPEGLFPHVAGPVIA